MRRDKPFKGHPSWRLVRWIGCWLLIPLNGLWAFEAQGPEIDAQRQTNRQQAAEWTERMRAEAGEDADWWVADGIVANRRERWVRIKAEATGIGPGSAVEFVLISARSGHDYEALAISLAEPSAIHKALEFIGLPPGQPVDPARLRFWPRGERVLITFRWNPPDGAPVSRSAAAESLLYDQRQQAELPVRGFVFGGSTQRLHPQTGETVYAADRFGPGAIVSCYNEPASVLDVPRLASQGEVYGSIVPHPERLLPAGGLLEITFEPEYPRDRLRVFLGDLRMTAAAEALPATVDDLRFSVDARQRHNDHDALEAGAVLVEWLAWLGRLAESGRDAFIGLQPDDGLPWGVVRDFYRLVETLERSEGVQIEPPPERQLYYRALLPLDAFRDRAQRVVHPDELHLAPHADGSNGLQAVWTRFDEEWPDASAVMPRVQVQSIPVADAEALRVLQRTLQYQPQPAVLLVFAPATMAMGDLHAWMLPLRDIYPTQYVFEPDNAIPPK